MPERFPMKTTLFLVGLVGGWFTTSVCADVNEPSTKREILWPTFEGPNVHLSVTASVPPSGTLNWEPDRRVSELGECSFSSQCHTSCSSSAYWTVASSTLSLNNCVLSVETPSNTMTGQSGGAAQNAVSSSRRRVFRMVKINGKKRILVIETDWRGMYGFVGLADSGLTDDEVLAAHKWLGLHREGHAYPMDSESKGRVLVAEVMKVVALANQICREITVSDHGIDLVIEFKDDQGEATGVCVAVQCKSGDSYLKLAKSRGVEVFRIRDERHARLWQKQQTPVMLVIRKSTGEIRWMEIRDYLKAWQKDGKGFAKAIEFTGEPFDVASVRRLRDQMLAVDAPVA